MNGVLVAHDRYWNSISELQEKIRERLTKLPDNFKYVLRTTKTTTRVCIWIKHSLKVSNALSDEASEVRAKAMAILKEITEKSILVDKKIRNSNKALLNLLNEIDYIIARYSEILEQFRTFLKNRKEEIKPLLKKLRELNSAVVKERRERAKAEREAIREGRFEEVSDKRIKEFLRKEWGFTNLTILDKSSPYRAVAFALLDDELYFNEWNHNVEWYVKEVRLAGVDDAGNPWDIRVDVVGGPFDTLDEHSKWSVEQLMSRLFGVDIRIVVDADTTTQGDILIFPCKKEHYVRRYFGALKEARNFSRFGLDPEDMKVSWESGNYEDFETFTIDGSHVLQAAGKVKTFRATLSTKSGRIMATQNVYFFVLPRGGVLMHKEHRPIELSRGCYAITPYVSTYGGD
jgi:hypothetical protein